MKKIEPFQTVNDAITSLDNGGRFYNFLTQAGDGLISPAELSKAAGSLTGKQKQVLFLEMAMSHLEESQKRRVVGQLSSSLQDSYHKYKSFHLLPSETASKGVLSANTILTGVPTMVGSETAFSGFIMIPIMAGSVVTYSMIPLQERYDVYEIRDELSSESFTIAHAKGSKKLPNKKIRVGGILAKLKANKKEKEASQMYLRVHYHSDIMV